MAQKELTKEEIKAYMLEYIRVACTRERQHTDKEAKQFWSTVNNEPDIVDSLLREKTDWDSCNAERALRNGLLDSLMQKGRARDLALDAVRKVIEPLPFVSREYYMEKHQKTWSDADEAYLERWLLCECDDLPEVVPVTFGYGGVRFWGDWEERISLVLRVCDFPQRYCAYQLYTGDVNEFKYPFRSIIVNDGGEKAEAVLSEMRDWLSAAFKMSEEQIKTGIMLMFAAVYCGAGKLKKETVFYQKYIDDWTANDREFFEQVIRTKMNPEPRKKVLKKLFPSS